MVRKPKKGRFSFLTMNHLLLEPGEPDLQKLLNWLGVKDKRPLPDGKLVQHSLQGYDNLMRKGGLQ